MPTYQAPPPGSDTRVSPKDKQSGTARGSSSGVVALAADSSPRPRSATNPWPVVRTPRRALEPPLTPRTPRPDPAAVSDRNIKAAQDAAHCIDQIKGRSARLCAFQSVLSQAAAIAPAARGPVLDALAQSLNSLGESDRSACLAELRALSADMGLDYRRAFLGRLLKQFISNRDSASGSSSSDSMVSDAYQFQKDHGDTEDRQKAISELLQAPLTSDSLPGLQKLLRQGSASSVDRGVLASLIIRLEHLDAASQKRIVELCARDGFTLPMVLGALFQSPYMVEIELLAKKGGHSLSALFTGALIGDRSSAQKLLLVLGRIALPEALHVYLCEQIGGLRRTGARAPTTASEAGALLMETVAVSRMSEANRCLLIHSLSAVDEDKLYLALQEGELNEQHDYWGYAHDVIASVIDIGTCYMLTSGNGTDAELASYTARASEMLKNDTARAIARLGKCDWDKAQLRKLMLESTDTKAIKAAVFNVLESDLPFDEKLALLQCETTPVGANIEQHVSEARFNAARRLYEQRHPASKSKNPAYEAVAEDPKAYKTAYGKFTKDLDTDALFDIKEAGKRAMVKAQNSRLPAMHVLVDMGNSMLVSAYMETVAGFCGVLPAQDIVGFLAYASNGVSLLHRAMMKGTPEVVRKCMSRILESGLTREEKIGLLAARRELDGLGAFYLAMSIGDTDRAIPFVQGVLNASQFDSAAKIMLLQCAKGALPANAGMNDNALKVWKRAGITAREEAEHRKHHRLVMEFDKLIERSGLSSDEKLKLHTS